MTKDRKQTKNDRMTLTGNVRLNALGHEAHLWLAHSDGAVDHRFVDAHIKLLSDEESQKLDRFRFRRHRERYLLSRVLLRKALSWYVDVPPRSWTFTRNQYGKPCFSGSEARHGIQFSLSRTEGLAACLISKHIDAGVDVEHISAIDDMDFLARNVCSTREIKHLSSLGDKLRLEFFFRYWTLKEAYLKGCGRGLTVSPCNLDFSSDTTRHITLSISPAVEGLDSRWQFESYRLTSMHAMAVALRTVHRGKMKLRVRDAGELFA